jgi:hypothetical protein
MVSGGITGAGRSSRPGDWFKTLSFDLAADGTRLVSDPDAESLERDGCRRQLPQLFDADFGEDGYARCTVSRVPVRYFT